MKSTQIFAVAIAMTVLVVLGSVVFAMYLHRLRSTPASPLTLQNPLPATRSILPINIEMVRIEPGIFMMGDPADTDITRDDHVHQVTLSRPFLIGKYPVTVAQFKQFVADTGRRTAAETKGFSMVHADHPETFRAQRGLTWENAFPNLPDSVPVVCVNWYDARAFCEWVDDRTGRKTRLPTEAEWEYACRAGTDSKFSVDAAPESLGWFAGNSGDHVFSDEALARRSFTAFKQKVIAEHCGPRPVGQKEPNRWGLYDMHGNVWEWCFDVVAAYPIQPVVDPTGPNDPSAKYRIARGGDWFDPPVIGTSFNRGWWAPAAPYYHIGFRIVQEL